MAVRLHFLFYLLLLSAHPLLLPRVNSYVRIIGTLKTFSSKRHINVTRLRKVDDFNEILFHPIECVFVHKFYTDGPVRIPLFRSLPSSPD